MKLDSVDVEQAPKIIRGPSRIVLLEAIFFKPEMIMTFDLDRPLHGDNPQLMVNLLGVIPTKVMQSKVLIIDYFRDRHDANHRRKTVSIIVYDDHLLKGRFTSSRTIEEFLKEGWY